MKTNIKLLTIVTAMILSSLVTTQKASAQHIGVSFQVFYEQLSPYGQWVDFPNYGYVWLPDAGPDFAPYSSNGYWIMTEYGMTWVSNYSWGWAPFHYGRWLYDNYYGWFWVPDNEWGPAWVSWRYSNGYYGWEPMRPGVTITISFNSHYDRHYHHWVFVRERDIDRTDIHRCYVHRRDHDRIIRNSRVLNNSYIDRTNNVTYVSGPDRNTLRGSIGRDVRTASIHDHNRPGQDFRDNQLYIYRPRVERNNDKDRKIAPSRISRLDDVKPYSARNSKIQDQNREQNENFRQNRLDDNQNQRVKRDDNERYNQRQNQGNRENNRMNQQKDNENKLQRKNDNRSDQHYRNNRQQDNSRQSGKNSGDRQSGSKSDRGKGRNK